MLIPTGALEFLEVFSGFRARGTLRMERALDQKTHVVQKREFPAARCAPQQRVQPIAPATYSKNRSIDR